MIRYSRNDSRFKNFFGFIDLNKQSHLVWPSSIRDWRSQRTGRFFFGLMNKCKMQDYREHLELFVTDLEGAVKRLYGGQVKN